MEDSLISLDIFPLLANYLDYSTLENFKNVNKFCNKIYKKEVLRRKKSYYPFGDRNSRVKFVINDIYLEEIFCINQNLEIRKITFDKISIPSISESLDKWFHYSFRLNKWILTGKIIKSIIRLNNKIPEIERSRDIISLIFHFKNKELILYKIE